MCAAVGQGVHYCSISEGALEWVWGGAIRGSIGFDVTIDTLLSSAWMAS